MDTKNRYSALRITLTGLFMALTIVFASFYIPVPGGHLYLCDMVISLAAILLNPFEAFAVGGIGSYLGDLIFYPAPRYVSLVTHGTQAVVISVFVHYVMKNRPKAAAGIGVTFGAVIMVVGVMAACSKATDADKGVTEAVADAANNADNGDSDDTIYRTLDQIKKSGSIKIGVFSDKNPFGYVDENGKYQGYDVYFARRIAEDLGVEVEFVSTEAANRVEALQTGKVDIILANFTVTEERAQQVDFALPYMNVALGVVSPSDKVITELSQIGTDDAVIVISGTTAEIYLEENNPEITLKKYDTYSDAKTAFENGQGVAWANDNTEVIAYANTVDGYTVGIPKLGSDDTIAPAVTKGNKTLLTWINDEIKALADEQFFHKDYEETLVDTYGKDYEEELVVEGGVIK